MLVSEIYDDAVEALGFAANQQTKVFGRLTDAIEVLANKGSWEPLLAYLVIPTISDDVVDPNTGGTIIFLPDSVEAPLTVNLNGEPAFGRNKMYEFTMNGPGTYDEPVDWNWVDQGTISTLTASQFGDIETTSTTGDQRVIRISKGSPSVRMLVRMRTTKITSMSQFIPLHSKLAIVMMLKALESYWRGNPEDFQLAQGQEAQALKFLGEEQQSRDSFQEIAKAISRPRIIGYNYHSNNMVVVADIYDEASEIIPGAGKSHVFDGITEAVECLSNKGQFDAMTGYLTMAPTGTKIGLPRQVEIPIRINIESKPSMARDRLFEFTVNGPGSELTEATTLTWQDAGSGPLQTAIDPPSPISIHGTAADEGKQVTLKGVDVDGNEVTHTYTIPATLGPIEAVVSAPIVWKDVYEVTKDRTQGIVELGANYGIVAVYYPDETKPSFRQIKLNKQADEIKIMYRRASLQITSVSDVIPLKSRTAILNMMRSLQLYKVPDITPDKIQIAQALEANAIKYLQEEEQSKLAYIQASMKDNMPAFGLNYNSRGVLTAQDVYDDVADIFGPIGQQRIFDKITEGMEMLANKSQWDGLDGYVDILADGKGYITLPAKVETPVGMAFYGTPAQIRSKWYEFHLNGAGGCSDCSGFADDRGESPISHEPPTPVRLYAVTNFAVDADAKIRAYGYDQVGNWIRSLEGDEYVDGEIVPVAVRTSSEAPAVIPVTSHEFNQITRVSKDKTDMQIELWGGTANYTPQEFTMPAVKDTENPATPYFLAYYEADETEPMFRRFDVPCWVRWVRMRFRLATLKITKKSDVINLKSKTALVTILRGLKALEAGQVDAANGFIQTAVQLANEEQQSRNPFETFTLQFDQGTCFADPLQGQY